MLVQRYPLFLHGDFQGYGDTLSTPYRLRGYIPFRFNKMIEEGQALYDVMSFVYDDPPMELTGQIIVSIPPGVQRPLDTFDTSTNWLVEVRGTIEGYSSVGVPLRVPNVAFVGYKRDQEIRNALLAAERGDPEAEFNLGELYSSTDNPDVSEAKRWWTRAAEHGHPLAQYRLGAVSYQKHDYGLAAKWWGEAAAHGHAMAQVDLGLLYDRGEGVQLDHDKAAELYLRAAQQGSVQGQYNLGVSYANGEGVQRDYVQAYMWLYLAKPNAEFDVDENCIAVANHLSPDAIARAKAAALQWKLARTP